MSSQDSSPVGPLVEPLTRREREILALLAQGHSAPEIAERLTLALSSVKWHIQQLYGKLGVNDKRQAVARGRELGLLETQPTAAQFEPAPPARYGSIGSTPFQAVPAHASQPGSAARNNLPLQVTRFFGREREIVHLKERLTEHRLVTLTGSGGVGKTRLSLQAANELLDDFPDGVWLVELALLSDPALVVQQVASSMGLRDEAGRPILETLTEYLRDRQVLLVLDNCEHLLESCARLADALLRACPRVKLLASSRELLGNPGEAVFHVPSLPFPDPDHLPPIKELNNYVALGLFVDRARLLLPDYQIGPDNAATLARICQRLDGIPLAIEMAAARINVLTADQLASRLDDAFRLLTGGSRTALPRQKTLRATIDWSYQLLNQPERLLLQRLAVFDGGCTLEAAEAVCAGEGIEAGQTIVPGEIVDLLASLVAKSMVDADRRAGEGLRYRLLETVRQYAEEKLYGAGHSAQVRTRHRDYFLVFAETNVPKLNSSEQLIWARKIAAERENLRRALEWSFSDLTDLEAGPRLAFAMWDLWSSHQECLDWARKGLDWCQSHAEISGRLHAHLLRAASMLVALNDPQTALAMSQRAVEISRALGPTEKNTLRRSLLNLAGRYDWDLDSVDLALAPFAEAEALLLELGPGAYTQQEYLLIRASMADAKAHMANNQGHSQEAKLQASESVRLFEASGDRWSSLRPQISLGIAYLELGENAQAREHFLEALSLNEESGDGQKAYVSRWLGLIDIRQGKLDRAHEYCREGIRQAAVIRDNNVVASCLGLSAGIAAKQGQPARAAKLSGAAQALYAKQRRNAWEDSSLDTLLPGWREGPDRDAVSAAFEAGKGMSAEQAAAYALSARVD